MRRLAGIALAAAAALGSSATGSAAADAPAAPASCPSPPLSQPFLAWGDANWYFAVPPSSWTLGPGARRVADTLLLPSGSSAISPPICLDASDQDARALLAGSATLSLSGRPTPAGLLRGIGASAPVPLDPPAQPEVVRLVLTGAEAGAVVSALDVDPYRKG